MHRTKAPRRQRLYLNFYNDGERIKNHMVEYMEANGSVSKTLFGIELGAICKTPNRGRTKLVVETYPEIFEVTGDTIHLKKNLPAQQSNPPEETPQVSPMTSQQLSTPQESAPESSFASRQLSSTPQEAYQASSMTSQQLSISLTTRMDSPQLSIPMTEIGMPSFGDYIPQQLICGVKQSSINSPLYHTSGKEWFQPQTPAYASPPQSPPYTSPPDFNTQMGFAQSVFYPSLAVPAQTLKNRFLQDVKFTPFASCPNLIQFPTQYTSQLGHQPLPESHSVQSKQGEDMHIKRSEEEVFDVLSQNGGCMEVSDLVLAVGISPQDSAEQRKLYDLVFNSKSMAIDGNEIYVVDEPKQQPFSDEPSIVNLPEPEKQSSHQQQQQFPFHAVGEEQATESPVPSQEEEPVDKMAFGSPEQSNVCVDSIHVQNVNIETINLHLHVNEEDGAQVSELQQLKSVIQEMLGAAFKSV
eukprot:TRINITY_DN690_c0_g1_i1.p1 TRINITY_DN690_c0_g1~~TRINITY_DN690_c0_g1_i1.p1  ORF type:complete len:525 (-),score=44.45 TRINITY_DN690_c0_g1_i1:1596-2999(-)